MYAKEKELTKIMKINELKKTATYPFVQKELQVTREYIFVLGNGIESNLLLHYFMWVPVILNLPPFQVVIFFLKVSFPRF